MLLFSFVHSYLTYCSVANHTKLKKLYSKQKYVCVHLGPFACTWDLVMKCVLN